MSDISTIFVGHETPYTVHIGRGNRAELPKSIPARVENILILHAPPMGVIAEEMREQLSEQYRVLIAELPDAESAKRVEVAQFCWQLLGQANFTRSDLIISLGGGTITDIAGFVAATWLRGVKVIHIPTTILAMVDAAIGGKTGINTNEGKNMVGVFHSPESVIVDLEFLETLPSNELKAGYAEIVKCGFIRYPEILDTIEEYPEEVLNPYHDAAMKVITLAIQTKAEIVSEDFREQGEREFLNYGHTLGHAIEYAERYQWRHGAAVSIGMMYAAELARLSGRLSDADVDRHRKILEILGLPTGYSLNRWETLQMVMKRDKKSRGSMMRFVVLDSIGKPTILNAPEPTLLFGAYQEIAN